MSLIVLPGVKSPPNPTNVTLLNLLIDYMTLKDSDKGAQISRFKVQRSRVTFLAVIFDFPQYRRLPPLHVRVVRAIY